MKANDFCQRFFHQLFFGFFTAQADRCKMLGIRYLVGQDSSLPIFWGILPQASGMTR